MERTAQTLPVGQDQLYDVVRTSPFEFAQTAVGSHRVVYVGAVGVVGKSIAVDLAAEQVSEIEVHEIEVH